MGKWFKTLSPTMQIVVVVVGIILCILIIRSARNYINRAVTYADQLGESAALQAAGLSPTYTPGQYSTYADQLYYAMSGPGTDEDTIFAVFNKMQHDLDIIKLNNAFGTRDTYELQAWLRGDLSSSEMAQLNSILTNKGITKTF